MKYLTEEQTLKALACHAPNGNCHSCPLRYEKASNCGTIMALNAAALIESYKDKYKALDFLYKTRYNQD